MAAKIANEGDVDMEFILNEARDMWKEVRQSKAKKSDDVDALYQQMWKAHPRFCQAYPLVVGEMVQGRYHQKALDKYLRYLAKAAWAKSKDDWLRSQAHYNCILYKHIVPHYNVKDANAAEEFAFRKLKEEDASWEKNAAEVQREMEEDKRRIADLKRDELKGYLARLQGNLPNNVAGTADATNVASAITDADKTEDKTEDKTTEDATTNAATDTTVAETAADTTVAETAADTTKNIPKID